MDDLWLDAQSSRHHGHTTTPLRLQSAPTSLVEGDFGNVDRCGLNDAFQRHLAITVSLFAAVRASRGITAANWPSRAFVLLLGQGADWCPGRVAWRAWEEFPGTLTL